MGQTSSQPSAPAASNSRPVMPRKEASPTLAAESVAAKENVPMGPRDIECQIQLAVISGAATIAGHFVSLRLNDALAAENRGRVCFRINQEWERVIDATILQLNGVRATAAPFDIRLELTIRNQ